MEKKNYAAISPSMAAALDSIGAMKDKISDYEKLIKSCQKKLVSYVKKHRLQSWILRGDKYAGEYMSKRNERISKTLLRGMLAESLIERCTVKSKKYEWVVTRKIKKKK